MPKIVYGNVYTHRAYLNTLDQADLDRVAAASGYVPANYTWNLVKIARDKASVTFSVYTDFYRFPHPELLEWLKVDLSDGRIKRAKGTPDNPLILHRKETFVGPDHPCYAQFCSLTRAEEQAGLYAPQITSFIGRKRFWESLLAERGLFILGHDLRQVDAGVSLELAGRTAMQRSSPSVPARYLMAHGFLTGRVFDWGCGRGRDLDYFREHGLAAEGYDPKYLSQVCPSARKEPFDAVTLTYVLNVMPQERERLEVLSEIFAFLPPAGKVFITVRTNLEIESQRRRDWKPLLDGWLTPNRTFQKGFEPAEVTTLLTQVGFDACRVLKNNPLMIMALRPGERLIG